MTLQWTCVALVLYGEVAFLILLMLPWIRPSLWSKLFKSRLARAIQTYSNIYVWAGAGVLLLLFFDALREVHKYSSASQDMLDHPNAEAVMHMRLFRAQRNLYISGGALFLWFVTRRVVLLISRGAQLQASADAAITQARNASETASRLQDGGEDASKKLRVELEELKQTLKKVESDRDAMKSQSVNLQKEYDRVCDLLNKAEKMVTKTDDSGKKDD